jgi:hypothetical protein
MLNVDKQLTKQVMKDLISTIDDEPAITDFEDLLSNTNDVFYWDDETVDLYFSSLSGLDLFNKLSDLVAFYHDDTLLYKLLVNNGDDPSYLMEYLAYQALYKLLTVKQGFNNKIVDFIGDDVKRNTLINNQADLQKVVELSELVEDLLEKDWD